jgi:hypothetical protein
MSMILGQLILNYGFSNIVIGSGGAKFTLAESGVMVGVLFLLPRVMPVLRQLPVFWVTVVAILMPAVVHLGGDVGHYGLAALRDYLSVADLMYFVAGLTVTAYGLMQGKWLAWRNHFLNIWLVAGAVYGLMSPVAPYLQVVSPVFQSYQQAIPVLGSTLTSPFNVMACIAAWYAIPFAYPSNRVLKWMMFLAALLGTLFVVATEQSRNLYAAFLLLPVALAYLGYRRAFLVTIASVFLAVGGLMILEVFQIKVQGRISDVTLSAVVDRAMTLSGKHGDKSGAHGVNQRLDWWGSAMDKWSDNPATVVFGVGYGQALTNFAAPGAEPGSGVLVREPHNSYVSSLARGGLAYLGLWLFIILSPLFTAIKMARTQALDAQASGGVRGVSAWAVIVFLVLLMTAVTEPIFETPSIAAMYYFLAGIVVVECATVMRKIKIPQAGLP